MFFVYVPVDKLFCTLRALADCGYHNADHLNLAFDQRGNRDCPMAELRTLERNGEAPIEVLTKVTDELSDTIRLDHPGDECELILFVLWDCPDYIRPEDAELCTSFETDYGTLLVSECGLEVRLGREYAEIRWIESDEMETEMQSDSSLRRRIFKSIREVVHRPRFFFTGCTTMKWIGIRSLLKVSANSLSQAVPTISAPTLTSTNLRVHSSYGPISSILVFS